MPRRLFGLYRQPGRAGGEPALCRPIPDHRRAGIVAPHRLWPEGDALRIGQLLQRKGRVGLPQLLALPQANGPLERQQKRARLLRHRLDAGGMFRPAGRMAHNVMVGKCPHRPAVRRALKEPLNPAAKEIGGVVIAHQLERIALMQPPRRGVVAHHRNRMMAFAHLAHRCRAEFVQHRANTLQPGQVFGTVLVIQVILHAVGVALGFRFHPVVGGVVAEQGVVKEIVDGVETKPVHPALQPKAQDVQRPVLHGSVVIVQVGLRGQKVVQVILLAPRIPGPGRPTKNRKPV